MKVFKQQGMTLLELTVVLLILIALAGLAIPYMGGTSRKVLCDATDITMANVKRAIMDGYYIDTLGKFPQDLDGLTPNPGTPEYNLHYLFSDKNLAPDRTHKSFDPGTAIGWRSAGYLQDGFVLGSDITTGNFDDSSYTDPFKTGHVVVRDGWGRPIVIQNSVSGFRLVSAGPGSGVGIGNGDIDTKISEPRKLDDRILYLKDITPSADINLGCE